MDSITHALVALIVFSGFFREGIILAAVLGAVLPDCDIVLHRFSGKNPRLFIFSHGGFTHTIPGIITLSAGITSGYMVWAAFTGQSTGLLHGAGAVFLSAVVGGLTHSVLDLLAFPGIPLLYPFSVKKVSVGIFPGPSLLLFFTSTLFLVLIISNPAAMQWLPVYSLFIMGVIVAHAGLRVIAVFRFGRVAIPTFNPLKWLVVLDTGDAYHVFFSSLLSRPAEKRVYPKCTGDLPQEWSENSQNPEIRRFMYNSYIVVSEMRDGQRILRDPLREDGYVFYPPQHTRVMLRDGSDGKV